MEVAAVRKNKISLADYNYRKDIENRLLIAEFTPLDLHVLEEILYSPLSIPIKKLTKTLHAEESTMLSTLQKLSRTGLFSLSSDALHVDKEVRKYYEAQLIKFEEDFTPGMEYLQTLLRKVPIHILPSWYSIPRTSNNIFQSLVEKYLLTPQIFQRYLSELHFSDPLLNEILKEVYSSPDLKVSASSLLQKFSLSREQFEECMLQLEFHFVCCLGYVKTDDSWEETVTPFHEWREYILFLKHTEPSPLPKSAKIHPTRKTPFGWIEEFAAFLSHPPKGTSLENPFAAKGAQLHFIEMKGNHVRLTEDAEKWLSLSLENRALYLYRHPFNRVHASHLPSHLLTEKVLREAEKSILRVLHSGWVYFEDFLRGVSVPLQENAPIMLKKVGKTWKYQLPEYSEEEKALFKEVIFQHLFELGVTSTGTCEGKPCFCVTPFGQDLFGR